MADPLGDALVTLNQALIGWQTASQRLTQAFHAIGQQLAVTADRLGTEQRLVTVVERLEQLAAGAVALASDGPMASPAPVPAEAGPLPIAASPGADVSTVPSTGPAPQKARKPGVRTPQRLLEMLAPSAAPMSRADMVAELNRLDGVQMIGADLSNWVIQKRLREVAAAAESARAVLDSVPVDTPTPPEPDPTPAPAAPDPIPEPVALHDAVDPMRPGADLLQPEAVSTQPNAEPLQVPPVSVAPPAPAQAGPRVATGFVGVTDHATREARRRSADVETMTWSAVENYAVLNRIPIVGDRRDVLAKVNALRDQNGLPRWKIVADRLGVKEMPFPPLVAPRNGQVDAYIARSD